MAVLGGSLGRQMYALKAKSYAVPWLALVWVVLLSLPWSMEVKGSILGFRSWMVALCLLAFALCEAAWRKSGWLLQSQFGFASLFAASILVAAVYGCLAGCIQFSGTSELWSCCIASSTNAEVYGNLKQRNQLASLIVLASLACMYLAQTNWLHRWQSAGLCVAIVLFAIILALTSSRTGALQCLVLGLLVIVRRQLLERQVIRLAALGGVAYVAAVIATPWIVAWMNHPGAGLLARVDDSNALSRLALWHNLVELMGSKPWLGWGWSELAYAHYSMEFSGKRFMELLDNAHNLPLHLAVTLGLPAALAFCGAVSWLIWKNKPWAETNPERQFAWGALLVIALHSMVEYPLWYGPFFMTTVLCVGILCAPFVQTWLCAQGAAQLAILRRTWFDRARYGVATALLLGTALVAFDYHRVSQIYLQPEERSSWYAADPLGAAQKSIFFRGHARFALLMSTPLSRENATQVFNLSQEVIHFSPEPRVIERLIDAAVMLGKDDVAAFHLKRYKAAYPREHAAFLSGK